METGRGISRNSRGVSQEITLCLMNLSTVGNLIRDLAREQGSRKALTFPELNAEYTFSDLDEISTRVAKNLYRAGFRKGDRFAVWANNLPEWIIVQFATA